jgi:hypothetical protein
LARQKQADRLATRVVILDSLREDVLTPDVYDPLLNPLYRDVLHHYGAFVARGFRVRATEPTGSG